MADLLLLIYTGSLNWFIPIFIDNNCSNSTTPYRYYNAWFLTALITISLIYSSFSVVLFFFLYRLHNLLYRCLKVYV